MTVNREDQQQPEQHEPEADGGSDHGQHENLPHEHEPEPNGRAVLVASIATAVLTLVLVVISLVTALVR